jgi:hypothetical protein
MRLGCMVLPSEIAASETFALAVLRAAVAPGATREDIVAAAAGAQSYSVAP